MEKYKSLVFFHPDNKILYTVYPKNLEHRKGHNGSWCHIGIPADEQFEGEPFLIGEMVIGLISGTEQESHVKIISPSSSTNED